MTAPTAEALAQVYHGYPVVWGGAIHYIHPQGRSAFAALFRAMNDRGHNPRSNNYHRPLDTPGKFHALDIVDNAWPKAANWWQDPSRPAVRQFYSDLKAVCDSLYDQGIEWGGYYRSFAGDDSAWAKAWRKATGWGDILHVEWRGDRGGPRYARPDVEQIRSGPSPAPSLSTAAKPPATAGREAPRLILTPPPVVASSEGEPAPDDTSVRVAAVTPRDDTPVYIPACSLEGHNTVGELILRGLWVNPAEGSSGYSMAVTLWDLVMVSAEPGAGGPPSIQRRFSVEPINRIGARYAYPRPAGWLPPRVKGWEIWERERCLAREHVDAALILDGGRAYRRKGDAWIILRHAKSTNIITQLPAGTIWSGMDT